MTFEEASKRENSLTLKAIGKCLHCNTESEMAISTVYDPTIEGSFEKYGDTVTFKITGEQQKKIIDRLIEYYAAHCHFGEGIHQNDESIIDAPNVLSDICDNIIKFEEK